MSPSFHASLIVVSLVLGIASLIVWYLLYRWTARGTESGLELSQVSTRCHRILMTAWVLNALANGILGSSENVALTTLRFGISLTFVASLVAWSAAERHRRSGLSVR
jgi:uncharacterized membrane-anchored protein